MREETVDRGFLGNLVAKYFEYYENHQLLTVFVTGMAFMILVTIVCAIITGGTSFLYMLHPNAPYVFMDHFSMVTDAASNPYSSHGEIYPPLIILIYAAIGNLTIPFMTGSYYSSWDMATAMRTTEMPVMIFMVLILAMIISSYIIYQKYTEKELSHPEFNAVFICILFSYPVLFGLATGNAIFLSVLCCVLYIYLYDSDNKWHRYLAYIFLGVAAGCKIAPAFLGILTLKHRGYIEFGKCVAIVAALFFVPFIFTDADPIWYIRHVIEYAGSVPPSFGYLNINDFMELLGANLYVTLGVEVIVLGIFLLIILMDDQMERWEEMALLGALLMIAFTVSVSYTLMYMVIPLFLLLTSHRKIENKGMWLCIICFIVIFALIPGFEWAQKYVGTTKVVFLLIMVVYLMAISIRRQIGGGSKLKGFLPKRDKSEEKSKGGKKLSAKKDSKKAPGKNKNPKKHRA